MEIDQLAFRVDFLEEVLELVTALMDWVAMWE
jgi:hypothetical protein